MKYGQNPLKNMKILKFRFDKVIDKWAMGSGIQYGEHPLTHRLGKLQKQVSNSQKPDFGDIFWTDYS